MSPSEIFRIRIACGLTQEQLARRLRVSVSTIQSWEQDLRRPGGPACMMLEAIAHAAKKGGRPKGKKQA